MAGVHVSDGRFEVDAALLAGAFGLDTMTVRARMRDESITTRCETGTDADAGRFRLSFRHGERVFRLTVDGDGTILSRAMFPVRRAPAPAVRESADAR